jgi:signal transduction histidine kinase
MLRAPLVGKIAGANALIVVAVLTAALVLRKDNALTAVPILVGLSVLGASLTANIWLVALALRPLGDLERTALRFQAGDHEARVPPSLLADEDMRRVGGIFNQLLDTLHRDRERVQHLAERVVTQSDEERARLARELYDSTAQSIAALMLELSVAATIAHDASSQERLERVRRIAASVLEEIRTLSHQAHPRLLDERGLAVAMLQLVREFNGLGQSRVSFERSGEIDQLEPSAASVVYRVAQAALRDAVIVREAPTVQVRAQVQLGHLVLEVEDDGTAQAGPEEEPAGFDAVRHRVELLGGALESDYRGGARRVVLRAPLAMGRPVVGTRMTAAPTSNS